MTRYLAATHDADGIHPVGHVDAPDALTAVLKAQQQHGPTCGVMPPKAVRVWLRGGAALNAAAQRCVTALEEEPCAP